MEEEGGKIQHLGLYKPNLYLTSDTLSIIRLYDVDDVDGNDDRYGKQEFLGFNTSNSVVTSESKDYALRDL